MCLRTCRVIEHVVTLGVPQKTALYLYKDAVSFPQLNASRCNSWRILEASLNGGCDHFCFFVIKLLLSAECELRVNYIKAKPENQSDGNVCLLIVSNMRFYRPTSYWLTQMQ